MIKDALQYIISLSQKRVENIDGKDFYFQDGVPYLVDKCRKCETLQLSTLTSLVEYIKERLDKDNFTFENMVVHVVSESEVRLITHLNADKKRSEVVDVKARLPKIVFNEFMNQESFIIQTQAMFLDNEDKAIVLKVAGNVEDKTVAQYGDDGVTQKATIKSGLANVEDVVVPNPVVLKPYRTFFEIGQPDVPFVFRMRNDTRGVTCALFEADGGMWKQAAVHEIAEYLKNELVDIQGIVILS